MHETTKRAGQPQLSKASTPTLIDTLSDPNGWRRDTAQRLLVERGDLSGVKSLEKAVTAARDWRTRIHALWTLDGIDGITPEIVIRALADPSRDVRLSAVRWPSVLCLGRTARSVPRSSSCWTTRIGTSNSSWRRPLEPCRPGVARLRSPVSWSGTATIPW